jgi:hypothetical protein
MNNLKWLLIAIISTSLFGAQCGGTTATDSGEINSEASVLCGDGAVGVDGECNESSSESDDATESNEDDSNAEEVVDEEEAESEEEEGVEEEEEEEEEEVDADEDGYGESDDCDDTNSAVNPAATETCDGIDTNCSGDESDATDISTWYEDDDSDSYGNASSTITACTQPTGYVSDSTDCDDSDADVNTDGDEVIDGEDNDCDGTVDTFDVATDYLYKVESSGSLFVLGGVSRADIFTYGYLSHNFAKGDFDGDGNDDYLYGQKPVGSSAYGKVCLYYGDVTVSSDQSLDLDSDHDACFIAETTSSANTSARFGNQVKNIGDFNGDGYDDFAISDSGYKNSSGDYVGKVYVVYGSSTRFTNTSNYSVADIDAGNISGITLEGEADGDGFGFAISDAIDMNFDGETDLVVSAPGDDGNGNNAGAVYLLYGKSSSPYSKTQYAFRIGCTGGSCGAANILGSKFLGENALDYTGISLENIGRTFKQSTAKQTLAIGTPYYGSSDIGRVYLVFGDTSSNMNDDYDLSDLVSDSVGSTIDGENAGDYFGFSIENISSFIGGDSLPEFLIGAPGYDNSSDTDAGIVYLITSCDDSSSACGSYKGKGISSDISDAAFGSFVGENASDHTGFSLAGIGSIYGTGYAEILIGAIGANSGAGEVYLFHAKGTSTGYSGSNSLSLANAFYTGDSSSNIGRSIYGGMDSDGDGTKEIVLISHDENFDSSSTGFNGYFDVIFVEPKY